MPISCRIIYTQKIQKKENFDIGIQSVFLTNMDYYDLDKKKEFKA